MIIKNGKIGRITLDMPINFRTEKSQMLIENVEVYVVSISDMLTQSDSNLSDKVFSKPIKLQGAKKQRRRREFGGKLQKTETEVMGRANEENVRRISAAELDLKYNRAYNG